jgi:inosine-uridine nucleoside N-ribohydrolase
MPCMTRKIIIDCDPGIDDALAIAMALFDPRLEVLAITATAGTIDADKATHNVAAIVAALDPPKYPRLGAARAIQNAPVVDDSELHGSDGLGEVHLPASPRQNPTPSEKVIGDILHQHPGDVTLLCLGPLTNLARLAQHDPVAVEAIDKLVISGGSISYPGNVSPVVERNMHFDPQSADKVFQSAISKQLVPLDVTEEVRFGVDLLDQVPDRHSRVGRLLYQWLSFAFRAAHQKLGCELIPLYDPTALMALIEPELFQWTSLAGRVETTGELTSGMTVFDRRLRSQWHVNMDVATQVDTGEVAEQIKRSLRLAGQSR